MVAYLDSEYLGQVDTRNYLSRYDLGGLANCTKATRQTVKI